MKWSWRDLGVSEVSHMADGENMADLFVSQQIIKCLVIQDSSIAQALTLGGPAPPLWWERGRTAEFTAARLHWSTLCSPTEGEALEAWMLLDRDSGWQREQWKYLTKQKLKVKTVQNLSHRIQTDPKNKTHELTLHLAEQGGSEGEAKEVLAKTRK